MITITVQNMDHASVMADMLDSLDANGNGKGIFYDEDEFLDFLEFYWESKPGIILTITKSV